MFQPKFYFKPHKHMEYRIEVCRESGDRKVKYLKYAISQEEGHEVKTLLSKKVGVLRMYGNKYGAYFQIHEEGTHMIVYLSELIPISVD